MTSVNTGTTATLPTYSTSESTFAIPETGNNTQPIVSTGSLNLQLPGKFRLPEFDATCPEIWFAAGDVIFAQNGVISEHAKFSSLLQHLDSARLKNIQSVISNPNELQPYSKARQILLNLYAQSAEQKFEQLMDPLRGIQISKDLKPSLMLEEIKRLGNGVIADDALIKRIWMQKLPANVRSHIVANDHLNLNLDELVRTADVVSRILSPLQNTVASVETSATLNENTVINTLVAAVSALTQEVSAIKSDFQRNSRSRDRRSPEPPRYRPRTPSRYRHPRIINNLCWYHFKFDSNARRCVKGCKNFNKFTTENSSGN